MPYPATPSPRDRQPAHRRIPVPAAFLRVAPPPHLVLFNALGWQADLANAQTVYVSRADRPALRRHLHRLIHSPAAASLRPEGAAWALLEALHHNATAVLATDATPADAQALIATLRLLVAKLAADPAPLLDALAHAIEDPETLAVAAAVCAAALGPFAGVREPDVLVLLALTAVVADPADDPLPTLLHLGVRPTRPLGPLERRVLVIARAHVQLTAARPSAPGARDSSATQLGTYDALRALAAHPERFDPRLLRAFVRVLGAEQHHDDVRSDVA